MTFIRCWIIAVLLAAPAVVQATGCKVAVRRNVVVVQKAVVQKVAVVAATVLASPVTAYADYGKYVYGATYQPDGLLEVTKLLIGQNQILIQQNAQIVEQLRYQGQSSPLGKPLTAHAPMPPADPVNGAGGQLADITPDQNALIIKRVVRGEMPDKRPLSPEKRLQFVDIMTSGTDAEIVALFQTNCASCHSAANAKVKGNSFIILK